jgi:protoporphyrinogen oxidase
MTKRVIVLGGGPAGLSAAWKLAQAGVDIQVFEASPRLGGLSATVAYRGHLFDYGGHRFLTSNEQLLAEIQHLVGEDFKLRRRRTKILFRDRLFEQPLQMGDLILHLNPLLSLTCGLDYVATRLRNRIFPMPEESFEQWVVKRFGQTLYSCFFGPYTEKVWGVPPSTISAEWASQRIMVPNLWAIVKRMILRSKATPKVFTRYYYYPEQGIGQIWTHMAKEITRYGGHVHLNSMVRQVKVEGGRVRSVLVQTPAGWQENDCDFVISSIPLPCLVKMIDPQVAQEYLAVAEEMRYRSVLFLFLLIDQEQVTDNDALYVPEPQYLFFRVEQPKFWSQTMAPPGKTSLCLEVSCFEGDETWCASDQELCQMAIRDLKRIGLIEDGRVVRDYLVHRMPHVYPSSEVGHEEKRQKLVHYLHGIANLVPIGRQGLFRYLNMDEVIEMGFGAARNFLEQAATIDLDAIGRGDEYLWLSYGHARHEFAEARHAP